MGFKTMMPLSLLTDLRLPLVLRPLGHPVFARRLRKRGIYRDAAAQ